MLSALSHAWASWKTAPGVALLSVLAFAVGIGSATAIFTVINGVLLRPLPYPSSERFVALSGARTTEPGVFWTMSALELREYEQQTTSFDAFGWFRTGRFHLTSPGEPQFVPGASVTPALVRQLGSPALGQWFLDDSSVVLSDALWRRLGASRDIIGTPITLDGRAYTVTGVMPPAFRLPIATLGMGRGDTEVWIPIDRAPSVAAPASQQYYAYARRKPGVSLAQAQADVSRVAAVVAAGDPARYRSYTVNVVALRESTSDSLRPPLLILFGSAGLLLCIACVNVATLLLSRAVVRTRETAIHVALGASRRQLALRYFAEGALVSVAGAVAGVGLSAVLVRQILTAAAAFVPRADLIAIDWKVLGFSVAVAVVTGMLAGLAPLWQAIGTVPSLVLTEGVRASASAPARRLSQAFVVAEIAFAFMLLTTSAILIVHLRNLDRVPLGYDPDGLVSFDLTLPRPAAGDAGRIEPGRLLVALQQTPGVTAAAFASQSPTLCGGGSTSVFVEGQPVGQRVCVVRTVPDYLPTMRIPLRAGRWLDDSDDRPEPLHVVVNEAAARVLWPGRDPIGASAHLGQPDGGLFTIVGVVGDVRNTGLNRAPSPELYVSAAIAPANPMNIVVRSALPTDQVIGAVRRTLRQADPLLTIGEVRAMHDVIGDTLQLERLSSLVMTCFGLAALFMAAIGIYGVVSYFVRHRTVELGTRMALGAETRDLVALVVGGGLKLSLSGVAVGSIALAGGVWLLVRYLEVANFGWLPFAGSTAVVAVVSGAAVSVPAWRTTLLTPMAAIREQPPSLWQWAHQGMQRAVRDIRHAVGADAGGGDVSAADVLTAFVDAARGADSYASALRAVLASVCDALRVESAALLARPERAAGGYHCLVAAGAFDAGAFALPADGFLIARLRAYPQPLPFTPDDLAAFAGWATAHRPDWLDEIRALAAAGVRLAVPLRTRREILGVLLLGDDPFGSPTGSEGRWRRAGFTAQEKQVLRAGADQFALMIENARLTDRVLEQEALRRDIALASTVQRRLLPDAPPRADGAEFAATSVPARRIGGDYYDFVELPGGAVGIALADVSGKGVAAALIMSVVQASLRIISSEGNPSLSRLVARLNQFVYQSTSASKYATFFYAQFDGRRRQLRYVNAGHNPPYLWRAAPATTEGASPPIEQLSAGGTVVGMFPDVEYEEAAVEVGSGDVLLAFTDGVPEAQSPGQEEFGEDRLQRLLRDTAHLTAGEISARMSAELQNWIGDAEQYDDLTLIVMKVR